LQREKVIGKDKRKLIKKNIQHILEDPDEFIRKVFATYDNNTYVANFECHVLPEGRRKERWLEHWSQPIKSGLYVGGRVEHYYDITESKQAEKELKDSEERLKILFDYAPDAYYINDLKGNFIDGNKAAERLVGYKREELIGSNFLKLKLLSINDIPKAAKVLAKNIMGQLTGPDEFVLNRKDNSKVIVEIFAFPVKIKGKTLVLGIARDTTEHKKAEEEIRLHAAMMNNVAEGVYMIGLDDLLIKWTNDRFARMFGYDPGEMVGKQVDIVNAPTERTPTETRISIVDVLKETGEWHGEVRNIKRDGTHFWCYANVSLFEHPEYGKVIVSVHTEITERKQAEEKEKEHHKNIELLSKTAIRFVEFPQDKDIYTFIGEKLKDFTGKNSIIVVNSIDEKTNILTNRTVLGLGKLSEKIVGILGRHPESMTFDAKDEILSVLSDGKLHLNKGGLYGVFLKTVPKAVCNSLEKLLNIKKYMESASKERISYSGTQLSS